MANFYTSLSAGEIARQIALLLNTHNQLRKNHSAYTLMASKANYYVDIVGGVVVGCQATLQESADITRLFHLCVHPSMRRRGIARKLKIAALTYVTTPYSYVTIREDNVASINLNLSLGFIVVKKDWVGNHNVLTLGRLNNVRHQSTELGVGTIGNNNKPRDLFNIRPN